MNGDIGKPTEEDYLGTARNAPSISTKQQLQSSAGLSQCGGRLGKSSH